MIKVNTGVWLDRICRGLVVAAMLSAFSACAARRTPAVQDNLNANNNYRCKCFGGAQQAVFVFTKNTSSSGKTCTQS